MQGYFILSYDTDGDIKIFLMDLYNNHFSEYVNYFITKEYQYLSMIFFKSKGIYDNKESTFEPVLTCEEEANLISKLSLGEKKENLAVFTIIDRFQDVIQYTGKYIENNEINIHYYSQPIICTLQNLPYETDTNYRSDLSMNEIFCQISSRTVSHFESDSWKKIGFLNNILFNTFGSKYREFLKEYSKYLISYCKYTEADLSKIYGQKKAFAEQLKGDYYADNFADNSDVIYAFLCNKAQNTPKNLKCKIYLFHMLMNNLFVHYGYEIAYVLLSNSI